MIKYVVIRYNGYGNDLLGVFSSLENAAKGFVEYMKNKWEDDNILWEAYCDDDLIHLCYENNQTVALNYILKRYYEAIYNEFLCSDGETFDCIILKTVEDELNLQENI